MFECLCLLECLKVERQRKPRGIELVIQIISEEKVYNLACAFLNEYPNLSTAAAAGLGDQWTTEFDARMKFDLEDTKVTFYHYVGRFLILTRISATLDQSHRQSQNRWRDSEGIVVARFLTPVHSRVYTASYI